MTFTKNTSPASTKLAGAPFNIVGLATVIFIILTTLASLLTASGRGPLSKDSGPDHRSLVRELWQSGSKTFALFPNKIVTENSLTGNPASEWDISDAGDANIQGFAADISANVGETVNFKIDTNSSDYRLDIYRMGYYGGMGARKVATVEPSATLPQSQPACLNDTATGLIDCGNWSVSASWAVPATATSGIYFAKLVRQDATPGESHIFFIVRDDDGHSDLLFQTSDTTWQAYNQYGGNSLYTGSPAGRAYKVSYNRPITTRGTSDEDWVFNSEYPMVRWLERNGYDVSYSTGVDADRRGSELLEHKVFMSVGHDEYWSGTQRTNVTAARDAGVNLAFFSGNESFWKTRWEPSIDGSATSHRTLVCYKETHANAKIDPAPVWTGTWRDNRAFNPEGSQPENQLTGNIFMVNSGTTDITVPAADGQMRFWRNTDVATQSPGSQTTLASDTIGYEWDEDLDNGSRPAGLVRLSTTTLNGAQVLLDQGSTYGTGTATHHLTFYKKDNPSPTPDALVFGAGTVQWPWGLDSDHDRGSGAVDQRMQQATVNLFADMGVQPETIQAGLALASASTDTTAPTSAIAAPGGGATVPSGTQLNITGTAADTGGAVGGVEVSVDGGTTWHPAMGRQSWSFSWTPTTEGPATIKSRSVDDSGNIESAPQSVNITVGPAVPATCPCSIFGASPTGNEQSDSVGVELGVKFRLDEAGFITGIRYYKTAGNTGTHTGRLWDMAGNLLGTVTFGGESSTGWQQAAFSSPIAIDADTTYIASYHAPNGHYVTAPDFSAAGVDNPPLHALQDGADGPNGVFHYGSGGVFPTDTFGSSNYLVDVVFEQSVGPDTTPPTIIARSPIPNANSVSINSNITATFSEPIDQTTLNASTFELRDASNNIIPAGLSYNAGTNTATLQPASALGSLSVYTAKLMGGGSGIKDVAGNALASDVTWSFTTAAPPPDDGPGGPILVVSSASNPFSKYYSEILRAEGLNEFIDKDISTVDATVLAAYQVVIVADIQLTSAQATLFSDWVNSGGKLIAMHPDADLDPLLGITRTGSTLSNGYLLVDTGSAMGSGIVGQTIQFHGNADLYSLNGAAAIADLYSDASTSASSPAVTVRSVGSNGGMAAAFTFDLARSIVYTRQGNPGWAGDERDGQSGPIRSDDLFYGAKIGDVQPNWVNLDKVAIPQADEQQRLLANMITRMGLDRMPLPRFWYFPKNLKAVVIMTGDDHGNGGTTGQFDNFKAESPVGCSVDDWECVRSTSYVYPGTDLGSSPETYQAEGFEIGLHVNTGCDNFTTASLTSNFEDQLAAWSADYSALTAPVTNRTHCIAWSDWASEPLTELSHRIRLDTNYYYWPGAWIQDRPGMFTGSGIPMRFANLDGSLIDVYQATTQITDESEQTISTNIDSLLDKAIGPEGYYGAFTMNMHTDSSSHPGADTIVASAQSRGVPVVSAKQMLTWLDGRNASSFGALSWNAGSLSFTVSAGSGARNLYSMLPASSGGGSLTGLTRDGNTVAFTTETIKGTVCAMFPSPSGSYVATYSVDNTPPTVTTVSPVDGATGVDIDTNVTADLSEAMDAATINNATVQLFDASNNSVAATVTYDPVNHRATLDPSATLSYSTVYTARIVGGAGGIKDSAGNPLSADLTWSFTTGPAPTLNCPCTIWSDASLPAQPSVTDNQPIEVGTKFRSSVNGFVTGIRFYKGSTNTGTHLGHIWSADGTMLAEATFSNESGSGWQTVQFSSPVAVAANTTYVASYYSPLGYFAIDQNYFANSGVTNGPLTALQSGVDGPNGVYKYGASSFPNDPASTSHNYWVEPVFDDDLTDTTPPTVIGRSPAPNATNVLTSAMVTVQFSEQMNPSTIDTSSFRLRPAGGSMDVPASVTYSNGSATLDPSIPLQPDVLYYVTVAATVSDTSGNQLGTEDTWSFTTAPNSFTDTTVADFSAGSPDANSVITQVADGEVVLSPQVNEEFSGAALPAGWNSTPWTSGTSTVANGQLTVDGALAASDTSFGPGRSIEFTATFGAASFQHAGFGVDLNNVATWAMFSTDNTTDTLYARTNNDGSAINTAIPGSWIGTPHRYRIEWTASSVVFYIDGNVVSTQNVAISGSMRPVVSDFQSGGPTLSVDWLRMSPCASSGLFTSRIFDAGDQSSWLAISYVANMPNGTSILFETRTGDTPAPDSSWSAWSAVSNSSVNSPTGRYMQYRAQLLTSSDLVSPELRSVTVAYGPIVGTTAAPVTVSGRILDVTGRPVYGASVSMVDSEGNTYYGRSNPFGYYNVGNVPVGLTYVLRVSAKGKRFESQVVSVTDGLARLDIVASP